MNYVRQEMNGEGKLNFPVLTVLDTTYYKSTMLYDWTAGFADPRRAEEWNKEGVVVHYTMLFNDTKILAARQFGQWLDEDYYTSPRRMLQPVGIAGNSEEIRMQIGLAAYLANVTGRHFMFPNYVRHNCPQYLGGYKLTAPIMVVDFGSIDAAVPGWVEGTYLQNRERYTRAPITTDSVHVDRNLDARQTTLFDLCQNSLTDLLNVDFTGFDRRKLAEMQEIRDIISQTGVLNCTDCETMALWSACDYVVC